MIVNVSSGLAFAPKVDYPIYCASKAALHSYSLSLREQLRSTGIRVLEVLPPAVDTPLVASMKGKKILPDVVADAIIDGINSNKEEVRIGQTRQLYFMSRLAPKFILKKINA